jgi:hypothetical protein
VRNVSEIGAAIDLVTPLYISDKFTFVIPSDEWRRSCRSSGAKKDGSAWHSIEPSAFYNSSKPFWVSRTTPFSNSSQPCSCAYFSPASKSFTSIRKILHEDGVHHSEHENFAGPDVIRFEDGQEAARALLRGRYCSHG